MKKILMCGIIIAVIIGIFSFAKLFEPKIWEQNEQKLKNVLTESRFGFVHLSKLPFEWDDMYVFAPNTDDEAMYNAIGYKWSEIKNNSSHNDMQVVFVKDNLVVCYCKGSAETNGYFIAVSFEGVSEKYRVFHKKDNRRFVLSEESGYVLLQDIR